MKLFIPIIALSALLSFGVYQMVNKTSSATEVDQKTILMYKIWAKTHKREFNSSPEEFLFRVRTFSKNKKKIEETNKRAKNFKLELNKFADTTIEEFTSKYLGYKPTPSLNEESIPVTQLSEEKLPESVDYLAQGVLAPIKDQKGCGACWAFATTGTIEALLALKKVWKGRLSEQELLDCSFLFFNTGCLGGMPNRALRYVKKYGIGAESEYEYRQDSDWDMCFRSETKTRFEIKGQAKVASRRSLQLKAAVAKQPVAVVIHANDIMFYKEGIYDDECSGLINHSVAVVGYGEEDGKKFWLIRNSWGKNWGIDGYLKLLRQDEKGRAQCGIMQKAPVYPVM